VAPVQILIPELRGRAPGDIRILLTTTESSRSALGSR
jgi:hypothetical protein